MSVVSYLELGIPDSKTMKLGISAWVMGSPVTFTLVAHLDSLCGESYITLILFVESQERRMACVPHICTLVQLTGLTAIEHVRTRHLQERHADPASESSLQPANVVEEPRPHPYGITHTGTGHRRQHRDFHHGLCNSAGTLAISSARPTRDGLVEDPDFRNGVSAGDFTDWKQQNETFPGHRSLDRRSLQHCNKRPTRIYPRHTGYARLLQHDGE